MSYLFNQEILKQLIEENTLTFKGDHNNIEPPYMEFIFYENDFSTINVLITYAGRSRSGI